jgi:hypothetical protein
LATTAGIASLAEEAMHYLCSQYQSSGVVRILAAGFPGSNAVNWMWRQRPQHQIWNHQVITATKVRLSTTPARIVPKVLLKTAALTHLAIFAENTARNLVIAAEPRSTKMVVTTVMRASAGRWHRKDLM